MDNKSDIERAKKIASAEFKITGLLDKNIKFLSSGKIAASFILDSDDIDIEALNSYIKDLETCSVDELNSLKLLYFYLSKNNKEIPDVLIQFMEKELFWPSKPYRENAKKDHLEIRNRSVCWAIYQITKHTELQATKNDATNKIETASDIIKEALNHSIDLSSIRKIWAQRKKYNIDV